MILKRARIGIVATACWLILFAVALPAADAPAIQTGNMLGNPGFEDDYHNNNAEGHVLAFMGDWSFNASDLKPDYWNLTGSWEWVSENPHSGRRALRLNGGTATRSVLKNAIPAPPGGGDLRWGSAPVQVIPHPNPRRFARDLKVSLWYRGANLGGNKKLTVSLGSCNATVSASVAEAAANWQRLDLTLSKAKQEIAIQEAKTNYEAAVAKLKPGQPKPSYPGQIDIVVSIATEGGAVVAIDDVSLAEDLSNDPNLAINSGFEEITGSDATAADWSAPQKYKVYTQQYYKWTSWNHFFAPIRGTAKTTDLVAHSGKRSLLMKVLPGDEMMVVGKAVPLNQQKPEVVEIGAYVLLDRLKWVDIRAVDQDGKDIPNITPFSGGWPVPTDMGQWYPSTAPQWVYIRKTFYSDKPIQAIRPQLCARGFNGDTRDDGGYRPHVNQVGLAFWDDVRVTETTSTAAELQARGVKAPAQPAAAGEGLVIRGFDLGERLYGQNVARFVVENTTGAPAQASLSLAFAGSKTANVTAVAIPAGQQAIVEVPYMLGAGDMRAVWTEQGEISLGLTGAGKSKSLKVPYNTWPVIVDVDFYRHYATPDENPQTVSLNFGVAEGTLAKTKSLTIEIRRRRDDAVIDKVEIADLHAAMANTRSNLASYSGKKWETPNPVQFADRKNLLAIELDISKVPVHPQNEPVRDHFLFIRGIGEGRQQLFEDSSQTFGRVQPNTEVLPKITKTEMGKDGAVLVNGQPLFVMAGNMYTCGHYALTPKQNKKFGWNALRWVESADDAIKFWNDSNLYSMETMVRPPASTEEGMRKLVAAGKLDASVTLAQFYESGSTFMPDAEINSHAEFTRLSHAIANRVSNFGGGGAHNIYTMERDFDTYDTFGVEIEPMGPPRGGYELAPALRKGKGWFHLPQTYNNTPYDQFRFDQYATIVQGGRGFSCIHGVGDPSFYRGITGEIRYLSPAIFSQDHGDPRTEASQDIWVMQRKVGDKTTIIAVSKPAVEIGKWSHREDAAAPGKQAHTGISEFMPNPTPDGLRVHGFRESKPVLIKAGDKLVQYVWIDPKAPPTAIAWGVRGDAKWNHNAHYGHAFDFAKWRKEWVNFWLGGELLPGTWQIGWQYNEQTRNWFADNILPKQTFRVTQPLPEAGKWIKLEMTAEQAFVVGKDVDGFMFIAQNGNAWWSHSAIVRGDKEIVLCDGSLRPHRDDLKRVKFSVPWAGEGTKVKVLFEDRERTVRDGAFTDGFEGVDTYQTIRGGAVGDATGWHPYGTELKAQTIGYVTPSNPTEVHVYEIIPGKK